MGFHVLHSSGFYGWERFRPPEMDRTEIVQEKNPPLRIDGPKAIYADGFELYFLTDLDLICISMDGTIKKKNERKTYGWLEII